MTIKATNLSKQLVESESEKFLKNIYLRDTIKCENSKIINRTNNTYAKYQPKLNKKSPGSLVAPKSLFLQNSNLKNFNFIPNNIERFNRDKDKDKDNNDIFNMKKSHDQTNATKNYFLKPLPKIDTHINETKPSK